MASGERTESVRDELTWIHQSESSFKDRARSKGLSLYLVPLGCATTTGVLVTGLYNLYKKDSHKQQLLMRYRVLAQGITVAIAMFAMLEVQKEDPFQTKTSLR